MQNINLDYIIVSSYEFGEQWKAELSEENRTNSVTIIGPYEEFAKNDIVCKKEFYKKDFIREDFI